MCVYAGWHYSYAVGNGSEPHGESFACYTHAKNQLLKWKYSCLLGPQIKMHMADDNTNRAALVLQCSGRGQAVAAAAAAAVEAPF